MEKSQSIDFANFYGKTKKKQENINWNAFTQDEESSLLSRPSDWNQRANIQYLKKSKDQHSFLKALSTQVLTYLPVVYSILAAYTVFIGLNNFWIQDDRKYYFYDYSFLTSKYFTFNVVLMGLIGLIIQQIFYVRYSTKQMMNVSVKIVQDTKVAGGSFQQIAYILGISSQLFLIAFALIPADNNFNHHKLTPFMKFEDSLFFNLHLITSMLYATYIIYFTSVKLKQRNGPRLMIYVVLSLAFFCFLGVNALNEFTVQKIYNLSQEQVQLLLPYTIMLLQGLFIGTMSKELSKIVTLMQVDENRLENDI